jgi:hydroxymethylbilane synthase
MFAQVIAPDGESMVQIDMEASLFTDAETLGRWVADDLKSKGALDLLASTAV